MNMRWFHLLPALLLLPVTAAFAAEVEISVDYRYGGNHNSDFSSLRGSLAVTGVTDDRGGDPRLIAAYYLADAPLAEIIHDALAQGFQHGGAELRGEDADLRISGRILDSQLETVERDGSEFLQLTIRTEVVLRGRGRTIWQANLFGRGMAPVSEGMNAALYAALDRMIRELVGDDYFLMELQ